MMAETNQRRIRDIVPEIEHLLCTVEHEGNDCIIRIHFNPDLLSKGTGSYGKKCCDRILRETPKYTEC